MNPMIDTLGRMVLGNIWSSTFVGAPGLFLGLSGVLARLGHGETIGSILMSADMAALIGGLQGIVASDHGKLPQFFYKD